MDKIKIAYKFLVAMWSVIVMLGMIWVYVIINYTY